ncbi:protease inhibitor I42 family protein [Rhodoplanes roseus]|uniref:protease inhibitor I42 family protein n=1 Tax=Rhodoplanes roseus TaxID=29409 RepID=UPI0014735517|nr:protease inhibitor I42 family protein [Rhodoplanes roseus]
MLLASALLVGAAPAAAQTPTQARVTSATVTLAPGEETTVSLEENVTTGYSWRYDPEHSKDTAGVIIQDLGHERRSGDPALGAAGLHRWRLRGVAAGHSDLRFVYERPWEHQPPAREHTLMVEVR